MRRCRGLVPAGIAADFRCLCRASRPRASRRSCLRCWRCRRQSSRATLRAPRYTTLALSRPGSRNFAFGQPDENASHPAHVSHLRWRKCATSAHRTRPWLMDAVLRNLSRLTVQRGRLEHGKSAQNTASRCRRSSARPWLNSCVGARADGSAGRVVRPRNHAGW
jgi:hypothetical protein